MNEKDRLENEFLNLCQDRHFDKLVKFVKVYKDKIDIDGGFTWACAYNHTKVAKYFLKEHTSDIHAKNNYAIRWTCTKGFNDLAKYLLFSKELKENASVKAAFLTSVEYNKDMLEFLILETDKKTRELLQEVIDQDRNQAHFKYPQELLDKMKLLDKLTEELPNNPKKSKKNKI